MKNLTALSHRFVEFLPEKLEEGIAYVSIEYATAAHRCCCGCGSEVVTPITPTDWQLTFDGESISLHPSIGNWSFACQSHYWIRNNRVIWAARMSKKAIDAGRAHDQILKKKYYHGDEQKDGYSTKELDAEGHQSEPTSKHGFWSWLKAWLS